MYDVCLICDVCFISDVCLISGVCLISDACLISDVSMAVTRLNIWLDDPFRLWSRSKKFAISKDFPKSRAITQNDFSNIV